MKNLVTFSLSASLTFLAFAALRVVETVQPLVPKAVQFVDDFHTASEKIDTLNGTAQDVAKSIREFKIFREDASGNRQK